MARCTSMATTEESTPPERPRITSSSPTCSRMRATASSMMVAGVQRHSQPQMSFDEVLQHARALAGWVTSGWNCTP